MPIVQVYYEDGAEMTAATRPVIGEVNALIDEVISTRIGNDMVGVKRAASIELLRGQFRPAVNKLTEALNYLDTSKIGRAHV